MIGKASTWAGGDEPAPETSVLGPMQHSKDQTKFSEEYLAQGTTNAFSPHEDVEVRTYLVSHPPHQTPSHMVVMSVSL
jgi:hypothetical protein